MSSVSLLSIGARLVVVVGVITSAVWILAQSVFAAPIETPQAGAAHECRAEPEDMAATTPVLTLPIRTSSATTVYD